MKGLALEGRHLKGDECIIAVDGAVFVPHMLRNIVAGYSVDLAFAVLVEVLGEVIRYEDYLSPNLAIGRVDVCVYVPTFAVHVDNADDLDAGCLRLFEFFNGEDALVAKECVRGELCHDW